MSTFIFSYEAQGPAVGGFNTMYIQIHVNRYTSICKSMYIHSIAAFNIVILCIQIHSYIEIL